MPMLKIVLNQDLRHVVSEISLVVGISFSLINIILTYHDFAHPYLCYIILDSVFEPVECDGCVYDNLCTAEAADFSPSDCCPTSSGGACTGESNPVICDGCEYANPCEAEAARFDIEDDCTFVNETPAPTSTPETPEPTDVSQLRFGHLTLC